MRVIMPVVMPVVMNVASWRSITPIEAMLNLLTTVMPMFKTVDRLPLLACCARHVFAALILLLFNATVPLMAASASASASANGEQVAAAEATADKAGYVGSQACMGCHQKQFAAWQGSDHDLAMQLATSATVLGDFSGTSFTHSGVTSRFFKRGDRFFVNTDDAGGKPGDFEIAYTFGVDPLQQYLIRFPNGALQSLGVAWDTRPAAQGGQRWFHVYGEETITHRDELHWTARTQTWNYQCADCHSINVRKNYDSAKDTYATTWSVLNVGCEGCHGPGAKHVQLAQTFVRDGKFAAVANKGLTHTFSDRTLGGSGGTWVRAAGERIARRSAPLANDLEVNTCARCHSRRSQLRERPYTGQPFLDDYRPSLLAPGIYHADGQIDDEAYVYGSFLQSRMHQAGVVCSDCHDSHSGQLRAEGNALCARCHAPEVFDVSAHHGHQKDSAGAQCVECHMPSKNYMVIDARRDHSIRVPRPDLSARIGTPNACNQCHADQSAQWAAQQLAAWSSAGQSQKVHYGEALAVAQSNAPDAGRFAMAIVADKNIPAIVRASVAGTLARYPPRAALPSLVAAAGDDDGLLRLGALDAASSSVVPLRLQIAAPNVYDDLLSVRVAAARVLAPIAPPQIPEQVRATVDEAMSEYVATQQLQSDHPAGLTNLGAFFTDRQEFDRAAQAYKQALVLSPGNVPASIGLADFYRLRSSDAEGEAVLRDALQRSPQNAELHHALGLALVRRKQQVAALEQLSRAVELAPD